MQARPPVRIHVPNGLNQWSHRLALAVRILIILRPKMVQKRKIVDGGNKIFKKLVRNNVFNQIVNQTYCKKNVSEYFFIYYYIIKKIYSSLRSRHSD